MQFAVAFSFGALMSRIPDLQVRFDSTKSELGMLLVATGVLTGLTFSAAPIEKVRARATTFVTVFGATTCFAVVCFKNSAQAAVPFLFIAGVLTGAVEINVNIKTGWEETKLGRRMMSRYKVPISRPFAPCHAAFGSIAHRPCLRLSASPPSQIRQR